MPEQFTPRKIYTEQDVSNTLIFHMWISGKTCIKNLKYECFCDTDFTVFSALNFTFSHMNSQPAEAGKFTHTHTWGLACHVSHVRSATEQFCRSSWRFSALLKGISVVVVVIDVVIVGQKCAFHSLPWLRIGIFLFSFNLSRDCNLWSSGHKLWTFRL